MVPSFVLTFTLDLMVALRDPALSPSSLPMMLAMLSNNSTATTGKAARSKSVKTASLAPDLDLGGVVSVPEADLVEVSVPEGADLEPVVDLAVALQVVVDFQALMVVVVVVVTTQELEQFLLLPIPSPTLRLPVVRGARLFMFAT
jgi:hypothetical protein